MKVDKQAAIFPYRRFPRQKLGQNGDGRDDHVGVTAQTTFANVSISLSGLLALQYTPINGFNNQILRALLNFA